MRLGQPPLTVARAARYVSAASSDRIKKEIRYLAESLIARNLVSPRGTDHLRNMCIDVQSPQLIASECEWIEDSFLRETVTSFRPPVLIRRSGNVIEDFV